MAYNYLDLVNEINRRLNEVELSTTNFLTAKGFYQTAKDAVNSSIRHINHEEYNWPWNHREEEETLTAGIARYPYPEDVKLIKTEAVKKAVIQYAGYSNAMIEKQKIKELSIE